MTTQDTLIQEAEQAAKELRDRSYGGPADEMSYDEIETANDLYSEAQERAGLLELLVAALRASTQEASDLRERLERVREWADKVVRRFHDSHPTDMPHRPFKDCTHPVCFNASTIAAELGETGTDPEPSVVPVVVEDEYGEKNIEWGYPGETGETP